MYARDMLINALLKHTNLMRSLIFKDGSGNGSDQVKMPAVEAKKKSIFLSFIQLKQRFVPAKTLKV